MKKSSFIISLAATVLLCIQYGCNSKPSSYVSLQESALTSGERNPQVEPQLESLPETGTAAVQNASGYWIKVSESEERNAFRFAMPDEPSEKEQYYLVYELYGVEDFTGIGRSLNDQLALGGYAFKKNDSWKEQREQIAPASLKKGVNLLRFSVPQSEQFPGQQIRNVRMIAEPAAAQGTARRLVVNQPSTSYYYQQMGYIQGFVSGPGAGQARIWVNGNEARSQAGVFEGMTLKPEGSGMAWEAVITARFADGQELSSTVRYTQPSEWETAEGFQAEIHRVQTPIQPGTAFQTGIQGVHLQGDSASVAYPVSVSITALRVQDMPMLKGGLVNVSGGCGKGYRMLPHGAHFNTPVSIALQYDPESLPDGYTPHDIYTYYYNEDLTAWQWLPRDSVDEVNHIVYSRTTHFTDFINSVLRTPEMPETQAYTPTMLKDLKTPHPLEGTTQIQPPAPNNMGTANLSYPIQIPNGRNGMQPQLTLSYNSSGGNGWLGLGWDISLPSITVETRWGVPTYSEDMESETYIVNGEQLVTRDKDDKPNKPAHREGSLKRDKSGKTYFYPRVEGAFNRIVRHGNLPDNYYWEVTDKSGTSYFYGKQKQADAFDPGSTLSDDKGNIGRWVLTEITDPSGNTVWYNYKRVSHSATKGKQLYIETIEYTGNKKEGISPKYKVTFKRIDDRKDVITNGRSGFLETTASLLKEIKVSYNDELIHAYVFFMENGTHSLHKTRLAAFRFLSAQDYDENDPHFNQLYYDQAAFKIIQATQYFNYFNAPYTKFGSFKALTDKSGNSIESDVEVGSKLFRSSTKVSSLGGSNSDGWSAGGAVTFGGGWNVFLKNLSAGGNYNHSGNYSKGLTAMLDINGDGLPDKVFRKGEKLYYRLQKIKNRNSYFEDPVSFENKEITSFLTEESSSNSWGLEAHAKVIGAGASGSKEWTTTKSTTSTYFSDVNGDGLPDIIDGAAIFYNTTGPDGIVRFSKKISDTVFIGGFCGETEYIIQDGTVDLNVFKSLNKTVSKRLDTVYLLNCSNPAAGGIFVKPPRTFVEGKEIVSVINNPFPGTGYYQCMGLAVREIITEEFEDREVFRTPEIDPVRIWTAPYDGNIRLSGKAELSPEDQQDRFDFSIMDGVRIWIQKNQDSLYARVLDPYNPSCSLNLDLAIHAGDRLYFKIESLERQVLDEVHWDPVITYIDPGKDPNQRNADGLPVYSFKASEGFILQSEGQLVLPFDGKVDIKLPYIIKSNLSDTVFMRTFLNGKSLAQTKTNEKETYLNHSFASQTVKQGDTLEFQLSSNTQINWNDIEWKPRVYYTFIEEKNYPEFGMPEGELLKVDVKETLYDPENPERSTERYAFEYHVVPKITSVYHYNKLPSRAHQITGQNNSIKLKIEKSTTLKGGLALFSIKSADKKVLMKKVVVIGSGNRAQWECNIDLEDDLYFFDLHILDSELWGSISQAECFADGRPTSYSVGVYERYPKDEGILGGLYRGWGQFAYNKSGSGKSRIDESELKLEENPEYTEERSVDDAEKDIEAAKKKLEASDSELGNGNDVMNEEISSIMYNPAKKIFQPMYADGRTQTWKVLGEASLSRYTFSKIPNQSAGVEGGGTRTVKVDLSESPIPVVKARENPQTIAKSTRTYNSTLSGGGGLDIIGAGANIGVSKSKGHMDILSDYLDLNGDRFPDVVSQHNIQFTNPQGGLAFTKSIETPMHNTLMETKGGTMGISPFASKPEASNNVRKVQMVPLGKLSTSAGGGTSHDYGAFTWLDINGDGLPDRVKENGEIELNTGYNFIPVDQWNYEHTNVGLGKSINASLGIPIIDIGGGSIMSGASMSTSTNASEEIMMDVNGDGLPDQVIKGVQKIMVRINNGNGFEEPEVWFDKASDISQSISIGRNGNLAGSYGFTFGFLPIKMVINGQSGYSWGVSHTISQLADMNGDGYPDYVVINGDHIMVAYSQIESTNLLQKVISNTLSSITLDYTLSEPSFEMPQRNWNLTSVMVYNTKERVPFCLEVYKPILERYTEYAYENPYYNRFERESFGYETIITYQHDARASYMPLYRKQVQKYHNQQYTLKGIPYYEALYDNKENLLTEKQTEYVMKQIVDGKEIESEKAYCFSEGFPAPKSEISTLYEGSHKITTRKRWDHSAFGNIKTYYNDGDIQDDSDDLKAELSYDTKTLEAYIVSNVNEIQVSHKDRLMRHRKAKFNAKGQMTRLTQINETDEISTEYQFNTLGNLDQITSPPNRKGQQQITYITYDDQVYTYPVTVANNWGYNSHTTYDYTIGKPLTTTDISEQEMHYKYDGYGRLTSVAGPNEIAQNTTSIVITYDYSPSSLMYTDKMKFDSLSLNLTYFRQFSRKVECRYYNPQDPQKPFLKGMLADSWGQLLSSYQMKEVEDEPVMVFSGYQNYDGFGRVEKVWEPFMSHSDLADRKCDEFFRDPQYLFTTTTYDVLDRPLTVTLPDKSKTTTTYTMDNWNSKTCMVTTLTDADGRKMMSYTNAAGQTLAQRAGKTTDELNRNLTEFSYNALGELLESKDGDGLLTTFRYNLLGQPVERNHPDANTSRWTYDLCGNLVAMQTQDLIDKDLRIEYEYDSSRLVKIRYPENPENNITYTYGPYDHNKPTARGRLIQQEDVSGIQDFTYGKMGELIKNSRIFALPGEDKSLQFDMEFTYDSWNRLTQMTYPDGEKVDYIYNTTGELKSVQRKEGEITTDLIRKISYNLYGQKSRIEYGNGKIETYQYDILQRLNGFSSPGGKISYLFDKSGNITKQTHQEGLYNKLTTSYEYDGINRLTSAAGLCSDPTFNSDFYNTSMSYSESGLISRKKQRRISTGMPNDYDFEYVYPVNPEGEKTSHKVKVIADKQAGSRRKDTLIWDANGNMLKHEIRDNGSPTNTFLHYWDEENRMEFSLNQSMIGYYLYDASGERVYKNGGEIHPLEINLTTALGIMTFTSPTLYINAYLVQNTREATKHYYIEGKRFASRLCGKMGSTDDNLLGEKRQINTNKMTKNYGESIAKLGVGISQGGQNSSLTYYYHSDHLGSTSCITNQTGEKIQQLAYLPYGEVFREHKSGTTGTPYTFSGKELDNETGYHYFGARYYNSELSIWNSVDPLADKYPGISGYAYCANNPLKYVDPDGMEVWITGEDGAKFEYKQGMKYEGSDKFAGTMVNKLNEMNSTEIGNIALGVLSGSNNIFNITNNASHTTGTASFKENAGGGGTVNMNNFNDLTTLSHELFHGYQHENNQGGTSVFNEVEANLFSNAVNSSYNMSNNKLSSSTSFAFSRNPNTVDGNSYENSINNLQYNEKFSKDDFNNAVNLFKSQSSTNLQGVYNNYPLQRSNQTKNLIGRFYPLFK